MAMKMRDSSSSSSATIPMASPSSSSSTTSSSSSETITALGATSDLSVRPIMTDINQYITCALCSGYLVNASTIVECLHTFCKTCIHQYLDGEKGEKQCPVCDTKLHSTKPLTDIREDKARQNLVYTLVPEIYRAEMQRRREFYEENTEKSAMNEEDAGLVQNLEFFQPTDKISMSIEWDNTGDIEEPETSPVGTVNEPAAGASSGKSANESKNHAIEEVNNENDQNVANSLADNNNNNSSCNSKLPPKRFLQCEAQMNVHCLKHFVIQKNGIASNFRVDILYSGAVLTDDTTLMDVAYIYTWRKTQPMRFTFRVREMVDEKPAKVIDTPLIKAGPSKASTSSTKKEVKKPNSEQQQQQQQLKSGKSMAKVPINAPIEISVKSKPEVASSKSARISPRSESKNLGTTAIKRASPVVEAELPSPKRTKSHGSSSNSSNSSSNNGSSGNKNNQVGSKNAKVTKLREDNLTDAKFLAAQKAKEALENAKKQALPAIKLKTPSQSSSSSSGSSPPRSHSNSTSSKHESSWKVASAEKSSSNQDINPLSPPPLRIKITTSPSASPNSRLIGKIISPPPPEVLKEKEKEHKLKHHSTGEKRNIVKTSSGASETLYKTVTSQGVQSGSSTVGSGPLSPKTSLSNQTAVKSKHHHHHHSSTSSSQAPARGQIIHSIIDKMQSKGGFKSTTVSVTSTTNTYETLVASKSSSKASSPAPSSPQHPSSSSSIHHVIAASPNSMNSSDEDKVTTTTKDSKDAKTTGNLVLRISTKNGVSAPPSISSPSISESKKDIAVDEQKPIDTPQPVTVTAEDASMDSADEDEGKLIIVDEDEPMDAAPVMPLPLPVKKDLPKLGLDITITKKPCAETKPLVKNYVSIKPSSVKLVSTATPLVTSSPLSWMAKAASMTNSLNKESPLSVTKILSPPTNNVTKQHSGPKVAKIGPMTTHFKPSKTSSSGGNNGKPQSHGHSNAIRDSMKSKTDLINKAAFEGASYFPIHPSNQKHPQNPLSSPPLMNSAGAGNGANTNPLLSPLGRVGAFPGGFNSDVMNAFPNLLNSHLASQYVANTLAQYANLLYPPKDRIVPKHPLLSNGNLTSSSGSCPPTGQSSSTSSKSSSSKISNVNALRNAISASMPNISNSSSSHSRQSASNGGGQGGHDKNKRPKLSVPSSLKLLESHGLSFRP